MAGKVPVNLNFTAGRDAMAAAIERCGISHDPDVARVPRRRPASTPTPGMVYLEDLLQADVGAVEGCDARRRAAAAGGAARAPLRPRCGSRRAGHGDFLERQHRRAEGRDADASQHARQHRRRPTQLFQLDAQRRRCSACCRSFTPSASRARCGCRSSSASAPPIIPNPTDAKTIGELARTLPRDAAHQHADLLRRLRAQDASPSSSRTLRLRHRRRRAAARADRRGIQGEVRRRAARRLRLHGDGAGRRGERARTRDGAGCARRDPSAGRCRASSRDGRRSRHRRRAAHRHRKACCSSRARTGWSAISASRSCTATSLRDGWYVTGDIATIDDDGFIRITDRLSRFSKIAGEMVPHMKVEERLQALLHDPHTCVVTSVPDAVKGERLVALYTDPDADAPGALGAAVATSTAEAVDPQARGSPLRRSRSRRSAPARWTCAPCGSWRVYGVDLDRAVTSQVSLTGPVRSPADDAQQQALPRRREQRFSTTSATRPGAGPQQQRRAPRSSRRGTSRSATAAAPTARRRSPRS